MRKKHEKQPRKVFPLIFWLRIQSRTYDIADETKIIRGNSQRRICKGQESTTTIQ